MLLKDIKSSYLKTPFKVLSKSGTVDKYGIEAKQYIESIFLRGWLKNSTFKRIEFLSGQGINSLDSKEFIIRYIDLKTDDLIMINNTKYEILSIENIEERNLFLSILIGSVRHG